MTVLDFIARPTPSWMVHAACRGTDPELFFPDRNESTLPAKRVCAGRPVRQPCLDDAVERRERFGIWGGLTANERRPLENWGEAS